MRTIKTARPRPPAQRGFFLIEAMVAILIFSLGILGLIAMGGTAIGAQSDARYRTDAASLAAEIANRIALGVDRTDPSVFPTALKTSLLTFAYNAGGANCAFSGGGAAVDPVVQAWVNKAVTVGAGLPGLPGTTASALQILVDPAAFNRVQITICWQAPTDTAMRRHTLVTYVN